MFKPIKQNKKNTILAFLEFLLPTGPGGGSFSTYFPIENLVYWKVTRGGDQGGGGLRKFYDK